MLDLLFLSLAFVIGLFFGKQSKPVNVDKLFTLTVITLLLLIGYGYGLHASMLMAKLEKIVTLVLSYVIALLVVNVLSLKIVFYYRQINLNSNSQADFLSVAQVVKFLQGSSYLLFVVAGIILGYRLQLEIPYFNKLLTGTLIAMFLVVSYQLGQEQYSLKSVILNKIGLCIASIVVVSSCLVALLGTLLLHVPLKASFLMSVGFGWYTLSGPLAQQILNEYYGSIVFFIDIFREILSFIILPLLVRLHAVCAVGYTGATGMDVTLPVLRFHLGTAAVPVIISSAVILTIATPILMNLIAIYL